MSDDRERRSHFERLYTLEGPADAEAFYADWAATYDADMLERHGYRGPALLADLVAERVPDRRAWILDIGCGTGLVGVELAARGFVHVDGLDLVQAMLDRASRTGVYHRLLKGNLLQRPAVNADRYDHAVSAGTFTHAHVGPDGLDEVVRLVRPGGRAFLLCNAGAFVDDGYGEKLERMTRLHLITLAETLDAGPLLDDGRRGTFVVLDVHR